MADTPRGPFPRLNPAAVERAKTWLDITDIDALGKELGFSRQSFWRVRRGEYDIRLSHALTVAERLQIPLYQAFDIPLHIALEVGPHA